MITIPNDAIESTLFNKPEGSLRGTIIACVMLKGKRKRIAHAYLNVECEPNITLDVPRRIALEDIPTITTLLNNFAAKVAAT